MQNISIWVYRYFYPILFSTHETFIIKNKMNDLRVYNMKEEDMFPFKTPAHMRVARTEA